MYFFLITVFSLLVYFSCMRDVWERVEVPGFHRRLLGTQDSEMVASEDHRDRHTVNLFDTSESMSLPYSFEVGSPFLVRKVGDWFDCFYTWGGELRVWSSRNGESTRIFSGELLSPISYNKKSVLLETKLLDRDQLVLVEFETGKYQYLPLTTKISHGNLAPVLGCEVLYYIDEGALKTYGLDSGTTEAIEISKIEVLAKGLGCRALAYSPGTLYVLDEMSGLEKWNAPTSYSYTQKLRSVYELKDYFVFLTRYDMYLLNKKNKKIRRVNVISIYSGSEVISDISAGNSIAVVSSTKKCYIYKFKEQR